MYQNLFLILLEMILFIFIVVVLFYSNAIDLSFAQKKHWFRFFKISIEMANETLKMKTNKENNKCLK